MTEKKTDIPPEAGSVKRLYRSRKDKVIAGVCGGIAEYLDVDPVWVRLVAVLLVFAQGTGILIYLIAWILIPENPGQALSKKTTAEETAEKVTSRIKDAGIRERRSGNETLVAGAFLVLLGAVFLFRNFFHWLNFNLVWPVALILLGIFIIAGRSR